MGYFSNMELAYYVPCHLIIFCITWLANYPILPTFLLVLSELPKTWNFPFSHFSQFFKILPFFLIVAILSKIRIFIVFTNFFLNVYVYILKIKFIHY